MKQCHTMLLFSINIPVTIKTEMSLDVKSAGAHNIKTVTSVSHNCQLNLIGFKHFDKRSRLN